MMGIHSKGACPEQPSMESQDVKHMARDAYWHLASSNKFLQALLKHSITVAWVGHHGAQVCCTQVSMPAIWNAAKPAAEALRTVCAPVTLLHICSL